MRNTLKLVTLLIAVWLFIGCSVTDDISVNNVQNLEDVDVPDGFDWDFTKNVEVVILATDTEGNPVEGKAVSLYKNQSELAFDITTNADGEIRTDITLPESSNSVVLEYDDQQVTVSAVDDVIYYEMIVEPVRDTRGSGYIYVPSQDSWLTLMYEDNWPIKGDYDFNDLIVEAQGSLRYQVNYLRHIEFSTKVIASGATYHNGFSVTFQTAAFPNTSMGDVITFTAYDSDGVQLPLTSEEVHANYGTDIIWYTEDSQMEFRFFDDIYKVIPAPQGYLATNTSPDWPWVDPVTIKIRIDYSTSHLIDFDPMNPSFNLNAMNPYVKVNGIDGYEIYLPDQFFSPNFSQNALLGTGDSDPASPYTTANGLSWALKLEGVLEYPQEKVDVILAYPRLGEYFDGTLGIFENWWQPHPDPDYSEGYIYDRGDITVDDQNN